MERIYSKGATKVHINESDTKTKLPKKRVGKTYIANGKVTIQYKLVEREHGEFGFEPVGVSWSDDETDYYVEIKSNND